MSTTMRKLGAGGGITLVLIPFFALLLLFPTHRTSALTCGDTPANPCFSIEENPLILTGIGVTAESTGFNAHVKPILDGLAWAVAKATIDALTRSIVTWINSGFNGSPAFVTDLNQNLQILGDSVADDFFASLKDNTGVDVRSPFQDQISKALRDEYYRTSPSGSTFRNGYTLNRYSDDPNAFLGGHFAKGGFDAWFQAGDASNNPIFAFRAEKRLLESKVQNYRTNRLHELDWGKGFMSWRGKCLARPKGNTDEIALAQKDDCLSYEIKTPGSVVEDVLGITATSPLRQLELADSVNEIVAALAGQLVTHVLGGLGLSGVSQPSAGGGGSVLDRATSPSQYASTTSSLSSGFIQTVATDQKNATGYKSDWLKIQLVAQDALKCVAGAETAQSVLDRATSALTKADAAISALNDISKQITSALSSTDSTAALTAASSNYQSLIQKGTLVTAQDLALAEKESSPAESGSSSLYTTLTNISKTCSVQR